MNAVQTISPPKSLQAEDTSAYITELQQYILPEHLSPSGELNWGRLICKWHEKKENGLLLKHTYAACIDGREGGIYSDCSPGKIFSKFLAHLFVRPLFTIVKTIYQLSLYPLFQEISNAYRSNQSKEESIKNVCKSLADIMLTPIYGLILSVATVAVLIAGSISRENLYEGRKVLGEIEQASNWGYSRTLLTLAKCFQPISLQDLEICGKKDCSDDTVYQDRGSQDQIHIAHQLANHARARIRYKKRVFDIFSCNILKPDIVYQSPILNFLPMDGKI